MTLGVFGENTSEQAGESEVPDKPSNPGNCTEAKSSRLSSADLKSFRNQLKHSNFPSFRSRTTIRSKSLGFIDGHTSRSSSHSFGNDYVELETIDTDLSEFSTTRNSSLTDVSFKTSPGNSYNRFFAENNKLPPPHKSLSDELSDSDLEKIENFEESEISVNTDNPNSFPPPDPSLFDSGITDTPTNTSSLTVSIFRSENHDASKIELDSSSSSCQETTADYTPSRPSRTKISDSSEIFYTSSETSLENKVNAKIDKFYKIYFEGEVRKNSKGGAGRLSGGKFYLGG